MHGQNASMDFYDKVIAPYKGALEEWFVANKSISIYFVAIFITVWGLFFQGHVLFGLFGTLPEPPRELKQVLRYKR